MISVYELRKKRRNGSSFGRRWERVKRPRVGAEWKVSEWRNRKKWNESKSGVRRGTNIKTEGSGEVTFQWGGKNFNVRLREIRSQVY